MNTADGTRKEQELSGRDDMNHTGGDKVLYRVTGRV